MTGLLLVVVLPLLCLFVHEAGHLVAGRMCGYRFTGIEVARRPLRFGVKMEGADPAAPLPRRHALPITASGPAANIALGAVAAFTGWPMLAVLSVLFGVANLLPFHGSDGSRLIHLIGGR